VYSGPPGANLPRIQRLFSDNFIFIIFIRRLVAFSRVEAGQRGGESIHPYHVWMAVLSVHDSYLDDGSGQGNNAGRMG